MPTTPKFTATNQTTESGRIDRLRTVWGYAVALAEHYGNRGLRRKIAGLHDHKGILTITWKSTATAGEKEFFVQAWKSVGDLTENVEHERA